MEYTVFDLESNGLLDEVTVIHCLSWYKSDGTSGTIVDYPSIVVFMGEQKVLVGHNIILYDIPVVRKVLGVSFDCIMIDTLALSWYLYPTLKIHGLEAWGEKLGVKKPYIVDWENQSLADYIHRCATDVVINTKLFKKQIKYLVQIYEGININELLEYLTFKLKCAEEQERVKVKVDVNHCNKVLLELDPVISERVYALEYAMPEIIKYRIVMKPNKMYKKDESLSAAGVKWLELLFEHELDANHEEPIKVVKTKEKPKASSVPQLKKWLFALGWEPTIFKYVKGKTYNDPIRKVPQISDKDGKICRDIKRLYIGHPYLENLESLFMLKHRQATLKGFIECANSNGYMKAQVGGLTNTLRFKHKKPIANLPSIFKPYGKEIRGAIIVPDSRFLLAGSDMSSLEDSTKQHYMYFYDPDYVKQMRVPGFDPHLDIALQGKMLTLEQVEAHKAGTEDHSNVRKDAKQVNFGAVYGVGPPKLSMTTGWELEKSTAMLAAYWERNKAVKQVAADITVKIFHKDGTIFNYVAKNITALARKDMNAFEETIKTMWLYNPVSKFWYSLRYIKDIFSTLNQGTGVYCFDTWVGFVREKGIKICLQYHDEILLPFLKQYSERVKEALQLSITQTNEKLQLNVPLAISVDLGVTYAACH
jgi:hypothetical protein